MKPPPSKPRPSAAGDKTFAPPTPRVSRQKKAKVLSAAEREAFLAGRPDLKGR